MKARPINLTKGQLEIVHTAAVLVAPVWRWRFLCCVADDLLPLEDISNADVHAAVTRIVMRMSTEAAA